MSNTDPKSDPALSDGFKPEGFETGNSQTDNFSSGDMDSFGGPPPENPRRKFLLRLLAGLGALVFIGALLLGQLGKKSDTKTTTESGAQTDAKTEAPANESATDNPNTPKPTPNVAPNFAPNFVDNLKSQTAKEKAITPEAAKPTPRASPTTSPPASPATPPTAEPKHELSVQTTDLPPTAAPSIAPSPAVPAPAPDTDTEAPSALSQAYWAAQLGIARNSADAKSLWSRMVFSHPEILGGVDAVFTPDNKKNLRIMAGQFNQKSDAQRFCDRLDLNASQCFPSRVIP